MKEISTDAKSSQIYSNHCVRSTTVTVLDAAGIPIHRIMQTSGHRNESSVKFYCDRQTLEKEKESTNILARFGNELSAAEQQRQELEEDRAQQTQISSQVQNNIVANVNPSLTLNLWQHAEFNDCNITLNIVKSSKRTVDYKCYVYSTCTTMAYFTELLNLINNSFVVDTGS